jgi:hypothetical protein
LCPDDGLTPAAETEGMKEVCAAFGLAAYHAQVCERKIMVLVSFVSASQIRTASAYDDEFERFDAQTLGQLLKSLRQVMKIDSATEETLKTALEKRNYLAHQFFWEHSENVLSGTGRSRMLSELSDHACFFSTLALQLDVITKASVGALAQALGLPIDIFQDKARREFKH